MNQRSGLTLIEFVVASALGIFVSMATLVILTKFIQTRELFSQSNVLLVSSEEIFQQLSDEIHAPHEELEINYQQLKILLDTGEEIIYELDTNTHQILKNGQPITPEEVFISEFLLTARSEEDPLLIQVDIELESFDYRIAKKRIQRSVTISERYNNEFREE